MGRSGKVEAVDAQPLCSGDQEEIRGGGDRGRDEGGGGAQG